jgi:hypothetical protein
MKVLAGAVGVLSLVVGTMTFVQPAQAIVGGQRDVVHTNVGVVRFTTESGRFRCSGTLISPTVVLTAGHCTGDTGASPATNVIVSFNTDLPLDPMAANITPEERAIRAANYITGTAHPDPGWTGKLSISKQHDQGVVVLSVPAATKWPGITPAPLLPLGTLDDANQGALKNATFTLVGYGVDIGAKKAQIVVPERRFTTSFLKNVQAEVVTFQINDRDSKAGGGSCFGDSGGPVFLGQYVVGDSSFVNSLTCNATSGYQRVDTDYSRNFLEEFI